MLSGDTLMSGAEARLVYILARSKPPQGGHSRSWHRQEMVKVLSDSSHEAADDESLLALPASKGAAAASGAARVTSVRRRNGRIAPGRLEN